ncbi:Uncharacterized protein FWK35_00034572, partial [Aphis craccivora]
LAHALHRVAEEIRKHFPIVDDFISNMKKVFLKSPSRTVIFKTFAPDIPLPPSPVIARWGTWINASLYYCEHLSSIKISLPESIKLLETSGLPLKDSIKIVVDLQEKIQKSTSPIGKAIQTKLKMTLEKNSGFDTLKTISKIIDGTELDTNNLTDEFNMDDITYMKFSPITSVDVERSFSSYKTLLADNRRSYTFENLKESLIVQCNSNNHNL